MKPISNEEFDHVFLDVFNDLLSNIVSASENAANEILDISSNVMSESVQTALTTFHEIYFSQSSDELKYNFNSQIDNILEQVQGGDAINLLEEEQSDTHTAGEQLANVQKLLEKTISSDDDLKAKIAPIMVGMQFAETTNQHLDRIKKAWQEIIINEHESNDSGELLDKIEQHVVSSIEVTAFYEHVKKQDPPKGSEEDLGNWIDHLFD